MARPPISGLPAGSLVVTEAGFRVASGYGTQESSDHPYLPQGLLEQADV